MSDLAGYVERAKTSEYFSGARVAEDLERFLDTRSDDARAVADVRRDDTDHIYLVGSGGSFANLLSVKYLFDRILAIPVDAFPSYELIWREPRRLDGRSLVFLASLSGETEDTVAALRFAASRGARTVALVGSPDSTLSKEADITIPFESAAAYELPMVALTLFACRVAEHTEVANEAAAIVASLQGLPGVLRAVVPAEEERAKARAFEFLSTTHMYVLGAGPLSALAYKMAMSVLMENVRIGGTYSDACEFRHGPAEALERVRPDMMFLLGTDASRQMSLRTLEFCRDRGARTIVYDAAEWDGVHPLLTPLIMNSVLQWFVVYSALLRGILDLDERIFMGHHVLAEGDAAWP
jgi:fructoselysine 6-phosphate deglycase